MGSEHWKIRVTNDQGNVFEVVGTEETLRIAYGECKAAIEATNGTHAKVIEINGITDSADRAELCTAIRTEEIRAVELWRMY